MCCLCISDISARKQVEAALEEAAIGRRAKCRKNPVPGDHESRNRTPLYGGWAPGKVGPHQLDASKRLLHAIEGFGTLMQLSAMCGCIRSRPAIGMELSALSTLDLVMKYPGLRPGSNGKGVSCTPALTQSYPSG